MFFSSMDPLQNWYSKLSASILNGVVGDAFPIHCGVRQGGILSPIYMDDLQKELRESGYGANLSNLFVGWVNNQYYMLMMFA